MRDLLVRSEPAIRDIDHHLEAREEAIAKAQRDVDRLQAAYRRRVEDEKARIKDEIERLRARQERVEWMARDPASIVDELAGCSVERMSTLRAAPPGERARATIVRQVERAVESVRAGIERECERRMEAIRAGQQAADRALQVQPGSGGEADLLLVPLWYVEWRKTLNPEQPERKRMCYHLATPLGIALKENGQRIEGELYPALTRYLQGLPGLGDWEGEFPMGREPSGKLAAQARQHACLEGHEIESLLGGMRVAVANGVYPAGYDEMVDKSRDDLAEWHKQAERSSRPRDRRARARGRRRNVQP
jgi:hypothetical protein